MLFSVMIPFVFFLRRAEQAGARLRRFSAAGAGCCVGVAEAALRRAAFIPVGRTRTHENTNYR